MHFLTSCFKGITIGAGAIIPGISSGVLCVIFGIYDKLLNSILNFFKAPKENAKFLLPLVIGGLIGVFLFSNLLNFFLYKFPIQTKSIFIGFILASILALVKDINSTYKFSPKYLIYFFVALVIGIGSVFLENSLNFSTFSVENANFAYLILCGFLMSIGIVVPGVSSTIILMLLGIYSTYLYSISTLFMPIIIPLGIGLVLGCLVFMKLIKFFLDKFYVQTFFTIIGFTCGSIFVLLPSCSSFLEITISLLCIVLGFMISARLAKA